MLLAEANEQSDTDCEALIDEQGPPFDAAELDRMAADLGDAEVLIDGETAVVELPVGGESPSLSLPLYLFAVEEEGEWKVDEEA